MKEGVALPLGNGCIHDGLHSIDEPVNITALFIDNRHAHVSNSEVLVCGTYTCGKLASQSSKLKTTCL